MKNTKAKCMKDYHMELELYLMKMEIKFTKDSGKKGSDMVKELNTMKMETKFTKAIGKITYLMVMVLSSSLRVYLVVLEQANT